MLGDCLERMKEIPDHSVDMVLCDLPYGTTASPWDSVIPLELLWASYRRIDPKVLVMFAAQPFTSTLVTSNPSKFRHCWVWFKSRPVGFLRAKKSPLRSHEDILVFTFGKVPYFPQNLTSITPTKRTRTNPGKVYGGKSGSTTSVQTETGYPRSVLQFGSTPSVGRHHPSQKPVDLLEYLIKTYTKEGDVVLDNTMGSGSTGVAAINTNRKFIGIEKDPTFYQIAKERIHQALASRESSFKL